MSNSPKYAHPMRVADLPTRRDTTVTLEPDAATRAQIANKLDLNDLRKLRFSATIRPVGKSDWLLEGTLGATVEQSCVVTLAPVVTRIDAPVRRQFVTKVTDHAEDEDHLDAETDLLGDVIDPGLIMVEALALSVPDYPRAPDASFDGVQVSEPGVPPLTDESTRPFAALANLRDKLKKED